MDIDGLLKRLEAQEDQIKNLKKTIMTFSTQLSTQGEEISDISKTQKTIKKGLDQATTSIVGLGKFDASLNQIRIDFNRALEEQEKTRKQAEAYREKIRQDDQLSQSKTLEKIRTDIQAEIDIKIRTFMDESQKTIQRIKEMEHSLGVGLRSEGAFRDTISALQQEIRQQTKKLQSLEENAKHTSNDFEALQPKLEILMDQLRKNESRLIEMQALETQRRRDQNTFIEQQNLQKLESSRQLKEWNQQIQDIFDRSKVLLDEYPMRITEINTAQQKFTEINERLERRITEITEMYRLLDERIMKNWEAFKAEDQKKWTGVNLLSGERQESLINQFDSMKERISQVEDATHELQDILVLMSSEIQKGMQNLMKMFNSWIDALGDIRSSSTTLKR